METYLDCLTDDEYQNDIIYAVCAMVGLLIILIILIVTYQIKIFNEHKAIIELKSLPEYAEYKVILEKARVGSDHNKKGITYIR